MPRPLAAFSVADARRIASAVRTVEQLRGEPAAYRRRRRPVPGGQPAGVVFAVRCVKDGGQAGGLIAEGPPPVYATCDWTYTVQDLAGKPLKRDADRDAVAMTPERKRLPDVQYAVPAAAERGQAYRDLAGELHLWDANELPLGAECDPP